MNKLSFRHWEEGKMTYSDRIGIEEFYNKYMTDASNVMPYVGYKDQLGRKIYLKDIIQFSIKLHGVVEYDVYEKKYIIEFIETNKNKKNRRVDNRVWCWR